MRPSEESLALEREIQAAYPLHALLYLDGRSPRVVDGKIFPGRRPKIFLMKVRECECGYPLGFTRKGGGGKSPDIYKMKRWWFRCVACRREYAVPRPRRIA